MKNHSKSKIIRHYSKLIEENGFTKKGMGWGNNQLGERYNIFLKYLNFKNKTILDYGCGVCNLYKHLKKKKINFKQYIGHDINPKLIKLNADKKLKKFLFTKKRQLLNYKNIDLSISNGVHNFKTKDSKNDFNKDIIFLFKLSKIGVGISFLNNNVDFKERYLSYKKINEVIKQVNKLECDYIIDQTFKKYETFLILLKK